MPDAGSVKAGGAYVEIGTDDSALNRGLGGARSTIQRFSQSIANLGRSFTIAGAAILAPLGYAIKRAGDFEEIVSKFDAVFKEQTASAKAWGESLAEGVGRSRADVFQFMATLQDTFVPLGFARKEGAKFSKQLVQLAIDLASFNNTTDEEALMSLQSAIVGNHRTMRKYGVVISETTIQQELLRMGFEKNFKEATEQEKVLARLNIIMAGTTDAQGDAVRTSGSFTNQMRRLKSQITEVAIAVGTQLLPKVTAFVSRAGDVTKRMITWVAENKKFIFFAGKLGLTLVAIGLSMIGLTKIVGAASIAITAAKFALASPWTLAIGAVLLGLGLLLKKLGILGDVLDAAKEKTIELLGLGAEPEIKPLPALDEERLRRPVKNLLLSEDEQKRIDAAIRDVRRFYIDLRSQEADLREKGVSVAGIFRSREKQAAEEIASIREAAMKRADAKRQAEFDRTRNRRLREAQKEFEIAVGLQRLLGREEERFRQDHGAPATEREAFAALTAQAELNDLRRRTAEQEKNSLLGLRIARAKTFKDAEKIRAEAAKNEKRDDLEIAKRRLKSATDEGRLREAGRASERKTGIQAVEDAKKELQLVKDRVAQVEREELLRGIERTSVEVRGTFNKFAIGRQIGGARVFKDMVALLGDIKDNTGKQLVGQFGQ